MATPALILPQQTTFEPAVIRAGDTVVWSRSFEDYPSADFSLRYVFVSPAAQRIVDAVADPYTPDSFQVTIPATTTAAWVPGVYRWEAYLKDSTGDRITIAAGQVRVLVNLETQTGGLDTRDDDEKILAAIVALISGKVLSGDAQMYEIQGRKLQRYTFSELKALRNEYALRVRQNRVRRGERVSSRTVRTAFCG